MTDELTLKRLITNPPGAATGHVAARYRIIEDLNRRLQIIYNSGKRFREIVYKDGKSTIFHIQVPSETLDSKFYWDVVFEIESEISSKKGFLESPVKIFSNNPAFVYSGGAFIANDNGSLIVWLKDRLESAALKSKPEIRNPHEEMGFDKTIYFAINHILNTELFNTPHDNKKALKKSEMKKVIEPYVSILAKYAYAKKVQNKAESDKKKAEAAKKAKEAQASKVRSSKMVRSSTTKTVKTVKTAKRVSSAKKTKKTRRI
jgi:hypothetical protein